MHPTQYPSSFKCPSSKRATSEPDGHHNSRSRFGKFVAFATRKFSQESKKDRSVSVSDKPDSKVDITQGEVDILPSVSSIRDELRLSTEETAYHNGGIPTLGRRTSYGSARSSCEGKTGSVLATQEPRTPGSNLRTSLSEPEFKTENLKRAAKRSSASLRRRFGFIPPIQHPFYDMIRTTSPLPITASTSQSAVSAIGHALMDGANFSVGSKSTCSPVKRRVSQQVPTSPKSLISESSTADSVVAIINMYANTGDRRVISKQPPSRKTSRPLMKMPILKLDAVSHQTPHPLFTYTSENRSHPNPVGSPVSALDRLARSTAWNRNHWPSRNAAPGTSVGNSSKPPALNLVPATPSLGVNSRKKEDSICEIIYDCYDQANNDRIATAL